MRCSGILRIGLVAGLCLAASGDGPEGLEARGAEILAPFKQQLQAALRDGMARGPDEAVRACSVRAPEIAAEVSAASVRVGRTSHKLRNPANAPAPWMGPVLDLYQSRPGLREPVVVALGAGRVGYAEPIFVKPLCVICHGEALAAPVRERIAGLYPEDRATGFRVGDFRGLFWAEFPAGN
jgi:hypothetical protein